MDSRGTRVADYAGAYRELLGRLRGREALTPEDGELIGKLWDFRYVARVDGLRTPDDGRSAYLPVRIEQLKSLRQEPLADTKAALNRDWRPLLKQWQDRPGLPAEWILAGEGLSKLGLLENAEFSRAKGRALVQFGKQDAWPVERTYWLLASLMVYRTALEQRFLAGDRGPWPDFPGEELEALYDRFRVEALQHRPVTQLLFAEIQVLLGELLQETVTLEWTVLDPSGPGGEEIEVAPRRSVRLPWSVFTGAEPLCRLVWDDGPAPKCLRWREVSGPGMP